jgi:hypothetical protein
MIFLMRSNGIELRKSDISSFFLVLGAAVLALYKSNDL